ncbi:MAG: nucleotidyltransferase substrate binding protein [Fimbriimonas ginsengisoli]|uniref:Nucleotidyltransferase substrate binding protein n=1 Tax=Fimbriimonas ginsengisoli TaxID=1005039 RepID=A0A931LWM0_FIMGI|nr:nucleotidyltransferase substrate binding protein [Fimbriimonas ginsengisoli]
MKLDITSFTQAVGRLEEGLARYQGEPGDTQLRDGLIQRFEFTYELAHKMLKRYLEMSAASPVEVDAMPFQDLIRTGNEQGLQRGEWSDWRRYREMRGKTSHTYDEAIALEVVSGIPTFLDEVRFLRDRLAERLNDAKAAD